MLDQRKIQTDDYSLDVREVYGDEGQLAGVLEGFLERPQQKEMARAVTEVFRKGGNLLVEAGTGTGKSLAYLVPAATLALELDAPVVVSTHTINLQEQLERNDLPLTEEVLDRDLETALVKGRENYLCPNRLKKAWHERHLRFANDRKEAQLQRLLEWAETSEDGTRSDLAFQVDGDVWSQVCSKRGVCRCLNERNQNCFYAKSREHLEQADLLLVNHYLFMQDIALRKNSGFGILPRFGGVIFDEAQHLEQVARNCLGLKISYLQFKYLRRELFHPEKETGLLTVIGADDLSEKVDRLDRELEAFFNEIRSFHDRKAKDLTDTIRVYHSGIVPNRLDPVLSDLLRGLRDQLDNSNLDEQDQDEVRSMINRITDLKRGLKRYFQQPEDEDVYWIERSEYRDNVTLRSSPVDVSSLMRKELFQPIHASVLTSATLTTPTAPNGDPFDYIRDRLGLAEARTLHLSHPFDYRDQVTLRLVSDLTSPSRDSRKFTRQVSQWLRRWFDGTSGQTFVLFTSYRMLNQVADNLESYLEDLGIRLLVQGGELSRRRMLRIFRDEQPAVIFGADAFWEGVDIRGKDLSHVIITKLPFPNPVDPLVEATSERLEKEGKNPFMDYFIPEAVLSLKQGFGRLIRSREDTGEITILDSRIIDKSYGRHFLDALPDCETYHESFPESSRPG